MLSHTYSRPADPAANRPRFDSQLLNRTVCIDEVADLPDSELETVKNELAEALTSLQAAIDEAYVLYGTEHQIAPLRYGRMRYKARILYGLQRRLIEEFNHRDRLARRAASQQLGSLFMEEAKRALPTELYQRILEAARAAMTR